MEIRHMEFSWILKLLDIQLYIIIFEVLQNSKFLSIFFFP